jgi:hypothetical protein
MRSVFVRCPQCATVNPRVNNFCGHCGLPLVDVSTVASLEESSTVVPQAPVLLVPNEGPAALATRRADIEAGPMIESPRLPAKPTPPEPVEHEIPVALFASPEPEPEPMAVPAEAAHEPKTSTTISGPSFLGLTDDSNFDQTSYLLEEERSGRRGGWLLFAVIAIIAFAAIGWLEWNNIKTGRINVPFLRSAASDPQPKPASATTQNPSAPATNDDVTSASANPDAGGDKLTAIEPGVDNKPSASESASESRAADAKSATSASQTETATSQQASSGKSDEQPAAGAATKDASSHNSAASEKSKPNAARAAGDKPAADPRTNKMLLLGEKYLYGRGVSKSCNQAVVYFRAAADEDNAPAMSHLGAMYASGNCVTMNRATAYTWFARAENADPNNQWFTRNLNMLWRDMTPQERAAINR